jgi:hypothetical protein
MPRRVNPKWGCTGMILLRGYGQMHDPNAGPGAGSEGFLLSDDQFDELMRAFPGPLRNGLEAELRMQLDGFREPILTDRLQRAQQPTRAESHKALDRIGQHLQDFLNGTEQLDFDWAAEDSPIDAARARSISYLFPRRLRALAENARRKARQADNAQLVMLADTADRLADYLMLLDEASEDKIDRQLPQKSDYEVRHLADAVRIAQRLELATRTALETSKKRGGPLPQPMMLQAVIWLAELVERYGGTFTHNPYVGLEYDGAPQTPAGQFVLKFLRTCDPSVRENTVSGLMAAAVKFRNRTRARRPEIRETSF